MYTSNADEFYFTGSVVINLHVLKATDRITLHTNKLNYTGTRYILIDSVVRYVNLKAVSCEICAKFARKILNMFGSASEIEPVPRLNERYRKAYYIEFSTE